MRKLLFLCLTGLFLTSCQTSSRVTVLKLAHALDISHPVHKGMIVMAEKLVEKSDGRMRIDIYPSGQLGNERELIEMLQIGSLSMTKVSTAPLESFVPEMKIFGVPYLFRDDAHRWKVLEGEIGKQLLLAGQDYLVRGLCYYDAGNRSFYTKDRPIESPKDLEGLKIRVMKSITSMSMVKSLGGSATPIPWGELYTALQQGVVDGAENNPPSFHLSRHYEVCKYYSLDEHTSVPDILLMSTVVWNRLSRQEQTWLQEAVDESVIAQRQFWKEAVDEAFRVVQEAGVQILYPDKAPFREKVKAMHESYKGTSIYNLIQKIEAIE
ncbi:TRAP transporter substrate-binding protein [candidate division KSB1 bacterium]|nr:TRAP transporter substrate-binding protein [candidate division KSB1 bacterium]